MFKSLREQSIKINTSSSHLIL